MKLSEKNSKVQGSVTLAIDAKAKEMLAQGLDVVSFGAGEPDFNTPKYIVDSAIKALQEGKTKYTAASGMPQLKKAISDDVNKRLGIKTLPEQVVVSNGAKQALFNALEMICNPGDEVLIFSPYWVSYPELVCLAGATPVFVPTITQKGFAPDLDAFEKAITKNTKAVILNTPSNPSGAIIPREAVEFIAKKAVENDFYIISDEIYDALIYDGEKHFSPMQISKEVQDHTIYVNGMSKSYAMTGWRVGYSLCEASLAKKIGAYQSHATGNINSVAQNATITALTEENTEFASMYAEFVARRNYMVKTINACPKLSAQMPKGAFYVMVCIRDVLGKSFNGKKIASSMDFANILLEEKMVAIVPGGPFGLDDHIRLSYATSMANIEKGLKRICDFANEVK